MSEPRNVNEVPQIRAVSRPHQVFMDGFLASFADRRTDVRHDERLIENGKVVHDANHYVDEPFIIKADDGAWVCALSIGDWQEADKSQRTTVRRSTDFGETWSAPVDVEPADGPEGSKAVLLKTSFGRIYAFYIFNHLDLREIPGDTPPYDSGVCQRVDSLGEFSYRYSDDHGVSWSADRYVIPMREFEIDRENPTGGEVKFGMNSAIPLVMADAAFIPFTKVGSFGEGLFSRSEGVLFKSDNILSERNVNKLNWETLPEGDVGMRAPAGAAPIAEEHSFAPLSDGSIHCVYRTIDGWPAVSYSRDGGYTWSTPEWMRYADGRRVKCPRAADFAWRCQNGKFLYWYHNHGGRGFLDRIGRNSHYSFEDRNPVWILGGREIDTPNGKVLEWSQPEIVLYTDDPIVRISYPDLLEDDGRYFLTETNKDIARIHEVDPSLFDDLWRQFDIQEVAKEALTLEMTKSTGCERTLDAPWLPDFALLDESHADYRSQRTRAGFTVDLWLQLSDDQSDRVLLDNRTVDNRGLLIETASSGRIAISLRDDMTENRWLSDNDLIVPGQRHHVGIVVDGGPNIITFIIDGRVNDGGIERQFGWGRFSSALETVKGGDVLRVGEAVQSLRVYERALRTTEIIGNYRVGG